MKIPDKLKTDATMWISRDSINGELSGQCFVWFAKPIRSKQRNRVTWIPSTNKGAIGGAYRADDLRTWFGTCPDTDLELIVIGG